MQMQDEKRVFFVVGAAKSGTSSLYEYLKAHPEIHMCPHKDVACYFCRHYGMPLTLDNTRRCCCHRESTWSREMSVMHI